MLVTGSLEKAKWYVNAHQKVRTTGKNIPGPCITISRETGSGAMTIGQELVSFFKECDKTVGEWSVYDKNIIHKVLEDYHLPHSLERIMEERKYSSFHMIASDLFGTGVDAWSLIYKTSETIIRLARKGNIIIIGRGGNIITSRLKNSFHVRLVAPIEERIANIKKLFCYSTGEAKEFIKKDDAARRKYIRTYFNKNIHDPLLYNLVLNTHGLNARECAELIGCAVKRKFSKSL